MSTALQIWLDRLIIESGKELPNNTMKTNTEIRALIQQFQGLNFVSIGPFLVADLGQDEQRFRNIPTGRHGMEDVPPGQKTEPHAHEFLSLYKSRELDVDCGGDRIQLPQLALTLVLPGVEHSWIPKGNSGGAVGSADNEHQRQVLEFA